MLVGHYRNARGNLKLCTRTEVGGDEYFLNRQGRYLLRVDQTRLGKREESSACSAEECFGGGFHMNLLKMN